MVRTTTTTTYRDYGPRADRQQSRLIWLIEQLGMDKWKQLIEEYMGGGVKLRPAVKVRQGISAVIVPALILVLAHIQLTCKCQADHSGHWERRDLLGIHPQKQPGMYFVGACVPAGRLLAQVSGYWGHGHTVTLCLRPRIAYSLAPHDRISMKLPESRRSTVMEQ